MTCTAPGWDALPPDRPAAAEPEAVAPEPVAAAASVPESAPTPEPEPAMAAASTEPVIGPAVQPIVIGTSDVAVEKKRGWWRR